MTTKRTVNTWLTIIIPIMAVLMLILLISGLVYEEMSEETFEIVHVGSGFLFVALAVIHAALNHGWIIHTYGKKKKPMP